MEDKVFQFMSMGGVVAPLKEVGTSGGADGFKGS